MLVFSSPVAGGASTTPHELTVIDGRSDYNLNPYIAYTQESYDIAALTMALLVRWGEKADEWTPEILTQIPARANGGISSDLRHVTLKLRPGVKWSDGVPFTARDVVFTAHTVTSGGASALGWDKVKSFRAIDDLTVDMELKSADANFVHRYIGAMRFILPEHAIEGHFLGTAAYNRMPLGAGMFKYARVDPGSEIVLEANPLYFRGPPKLKKIIFKIVPNANTALLEMRTGEADFLANLQPDSLAGARQIPGVRTYSLLTYGTLRVDFNLRSPITGDVAVRRALRYATNRSLIAAKVFRNLGALYEGVFISDDEMHADLPIIPFDVRRAKALLDKAGWHVGPDGIRDKGGVRLSVVLVAPANDTAMDQSIEIMRSDWQKVGVELNSLRLPVSTLTAENGRLADGNFDVAMLPYGSSSVWFENQWLCASTPPLGNNVWRYCDARVDQLVRDMTHVADFRTRKRMFDEIQARIEGAAAFDNIVQLPNLMLLDGRTRNIHANPWSIFERFATVDAS